MRKILIALLVSIIIISSFLSIAQAVEGLVDDYPWGANDNGTTQAIIAVHPSAAASKSAWSQSFIPLLDGANLTIAQFFLYQSGATGTLTAKIMGHDGVFGSSSVPNATTYATSDAVQVVSGTYALLNFTFASGYIFDSSQKYCLTLEGTSGDLTTVYVGMDTAPSHIGNSAYYQSSNWNVHTTDLCFNLYGNDGELVVVGAGGSVYITQPTNVYNVTASNATATVGTVDVSTGDINVGGVTAEFNNTAVNATGAITAGDVSAGDVTAAGGVTVDTVSVNGTITDAVLNMANAPQDYMFWTLLILIIACVILMLKSGVPIINFVFGVMTLGIAAYSLTNPDIAFFGYIQMFAMLMSILTMLSGYRSYRND